MKGRESKKRQVRTKIMEVDGRYTIREKVCNASRKGTYDDYCFPTWPASAYPCFVTVRNDGYSLCGSHH